ncbi:MAG: hypothetical protein L0271_26855, partial [Gemmatimonadetes bacterium]|nr:hypothetical protein [Gemmatimonadota bacterium]
RRARLDDAATHFRHALEIDPKYYWAHQGLALVSLYKKQYADARQHLSQVISASTVPEGTAEARRLTALTYLHERNIEQATQAMSEAARLAEADGRRYEALLAHRGLATIAGVRKDDSGVRHHIAEQERLGRFDALHHYWAALAWVQAGKPDLARAAVQALERENENADVIVAAVTLQVVRGVVLQAEGNDEEALAVLGNSGNHWAIIARYEALIRLGRRAEAERLLRGLLDQVVHDTYSTGLPVARYRFGDVATSN